MKTFLIFLTKIQIAKLQTGQIAQTSIMCNVQCAIVHIARQKAFAAEYTAVVPARFSPAQSPPELDLPQHTAATALLVESPPWDASALSRRAAARLGTIDGVIARPMAASTGLSATRPVPLWITRLVFSVTSVF